MRIFDQIIETENPGMCGGTSYYDIEDIYQAFKTRLLYETSLQEERIQELEEAIKLTLEAVSEYPDHPMTASEVHLRNVINKIGKRD